MLSFFAFVAIIILFIQLSDTRSRLKRAEATLAEAAKRIGALQRLSGMIPPDVVADPPVDVSQQAAQLITPAMPRAAAKADTVQPEPVLTQDVAEPEPASPPVEPEPASLADREEPEIVPVAEVEMIPEPDPVQLENLAVADSPPLNEDYVARLPQRNLASRFENLFGKQLPIWAGGITLAIAGVLIVKYAIDAGVFGRIFTHGVQVVSGLLFGLGLLAGAEFAWRNEERVRDTRVPQALSGAGIATLYASVLVAANAYGLIGPAMAFVGLAVITAAALGLSLRFGAPSALLGLAGGLAAPALTGTTEPNVPLLSVYLGLTIAGLAGVSRMRRWPWLAIGALLGGAGWSLWMMLASNALDVLGSLSVGGFVLLLAVALPTLAFDGTRATMLRIASSVIGALQLAMLVAYGGFAPLHWGLFGLIALAGQLLAWKNRDFAIVPSISLALSALLLAIWPDPTLFWFAVIGLSLAAIHALPLLAWQWQPPASLQRTLELCALALAAPLLTKCHFWDTTDGALALVALAGMALTAVGLALGWKHEDRLEDSRFAWLTATAATLFAAAIVLLLPHWQAPLGVAAVAAALLFWGKAARDGRIEHIAAVFAGASLAAVAATMPGLKEVLPLLDGAGSTDMGHAVIRWLGISLLFALFAAKAEGRQLRFSSLTMAGVLIYGTAAQVLPGWCLPLAMAAVALALFTIGQRRTLVAVEGLSASFAFAAVALLGLTGSPEAQWSRLFAIESQTGAAAMLRWAGLCATCAILAWRAGSGPLRLLAHGATGVLAYGFLAQFLPGWSLPLGLALVAGGLLLISQLGRTQGVTALSVAFALATLPVLMISSAVATDEFTRLWGSDAEVSGLSAIRWGGLAALGLFFAVRSRTMALQGVAQIAAALLGYGALAQLVPGQYVMLVPAIGGAGLLLASGRICLPKLRFAAATFATLSLIWAFLPLAHWISAAALSLRGVPMMTDPEMLGFADVIQRLLAPALLFGGATWHIRDRIPAKALPVALAVCLILAGIACHALYRLVFGQAFGSSFALTGLGQRLCWEILLVAGGWIALCRDYRKLALGLGLTGTAHALWYTLLLHNPLWTDQAVGGEPLFNLLIPAFVIVPCGLVLLARLWPDRPSWTEHVWQLLVMILIAGFAWATLRQGFHGSSLIEPGIYPVESILRSILMLALAIGYLLWGIRGQRHDWRIASLVLMLGAVGKVFLFDARGLEGLLRIGSFVALGFSLIGIGWLYSRQLAGSSTEVPEN